MLTIRRVDAPTASHFQSWQFFAVDHSQYLVAREIQHFSDLLNSQARRIRSASLSIVQL
jgi:hypothetical protein